MLDFTRFEALTFDCYGTLIDWESGIWNFLRSILASRQMTIAREEALELYAKIESEMEQGEFCEYRIILQKTLEGVGSSLGFIPSDIELANFPESLRNWLAFPDTASALQALKRKYRLGIISNVDDALFEMSLQHLQVDFDWIVTAQRCRSYK